MADILAVSPNYKLKQNTEQTPIFISCKTNICLQKSVGILSDVDCPVHKGRCCCSEVILFIITLVLVVGTILT